MQNKIKNWLHCATIRAAKTFAQTMAASIGTAALLDEIQWTSVLSASLLAALLSMLTSAAGLPEIQNKEEI